MAGRAAPAADRPRPEPASPAPHWHALDLPEVFARLAARPEGLSNDEAARRLTENGPNALEAAIAVPAWRVLARQFQNVLIVLLLVAAGLSAVLGHGLEAVVITAIVLLAVLLGFVQEYRAERAMDALRRMAAPTATALRDGRETLLPARDLVPGDIVLLRAGDRIPADARLVESVNLHADEAVLTGESVPVAKATAALPAGELPLGDRRNMAWAGTIVTYGRGRGIVVATGGRTEFGRIAGLLQTIETGRTPLQDNLDRVGHALARAAFAVIVVIVLLGLLRGQNPIDMLIFGIALAVAVVPEALPAVVTISLAIGVQRMVKRHALVRRLLAVETLGSTSVVCSDKTGTLTKDEMTVRRIVVAGRTLAVSGAGYDPAGEFSAGGVAVAPDAALHALLTAAALASDARVTTDESGRTRLKGDPTEGALVVAALKAGLNLSELEARFPRVAEIPFTSESKRMTTLHEGPGGPVAFAKGAPEVLVPACTMQLTPGGEEPLDDAGREAVLARARAMADEALRVLAVARRETANLADTDRGMTLLGLVGMIDPPRPEARAAIETCTAAGIKPVMITGDHPRTAAAVARELGLLGTGRVLTGPDLEVTSDETLAREVETIEVYARVSPAHKLRVVTAWQQRGHVVAMTGDGVNDAPALKKADIGIAMGISGTDVTREAASMTLLDDNFASIVAAVEEGRAIFGNIKKYLMYLLSSNIGEIGLMAGASLAGLPLPLTAVQILYVNLATDGLPALALAVDPPEADLMRRRPRDPRTGMFTRPVVALMLAGGLWSTAVNLGLFAWGLAAGHGRAHAMTMAFLSLVLIQFFKAYSFRSDRRSVLHRPFANRWLNLAIAWELLLLGAILTTPLLQHAFGTVPLAPRDYALVLALAATVVPVLEGVKAMVRRGWFGTAG